MDSPVQKPTVSSDNPPTPTQGQISSPPLSQTPPVTLTPPAYPPVESPLGTQPSISPTPPTAQPAPPPDFLAMPQAPVEVPPSPPASTPATPQIPPTELPTLEKKDKPKLVNLLMLTVGPMFMLGALVFSFFTLQSTKPPQEGMKTQEEFMQMAIGELATEEQKEGMRQILANSPKNPDQVTAVCQSTQETLSSSVPTDCPDPLFEWSGEKIQEEGTEIIGFYVYFGTNSDDAPISMQSTNEEMIKRIRPKRDGHYQTENKFSPTNLEKGTNYYLAVNAISDSTNEKWRTGVNVVSREDLSATIAKILFVYDYQ